MAKQVRSAMFKEAWFNPKVKSGNLVIVDRTTGKIQEFKLEKEYIDLRTKYKMTEEDKIKNVEVHGDGYDSQLDPEESWGCNGWKRMKRLEESE